MITYFDYFDYFELTTIFGVKKQQMLFTEIMMVK